MNDISMQHYYQEELIVALFLAGLDSWISSQIHGSILSEKYLFIENIFLKESMYPTKSQVSTKKLGMRLDETHKTARAKGGKRINSPKGLTNKKSHNWCHLFIKLL